MKSKSKSKQEKTYIEYGIDTNADGGGSHLIVESDNPATSERIFNKYYKKLMPRNMNTTIPGGYQ